jgi:hypothetical protein
LRCLFNKNIHINSRSSGIVGVAVAVEPPALNEVVIAAGGPGGSQGLDLTVERAGCDAIPTQSKWSEGGVNNKNAVFCPVLGASTFRMLGLKDGLVARVIASASGEKSSVAGCWVTVLANKGGRSLEESVFAADLACSSPHWDVCSINDLLTVTKVDSKMSETPAGGAVYSFTSVTAKPEDNEAAASALLEIFEGSPSSDDKNLGAVLSVYSASESGRSDVFLNWGSYWAVFQGQGLFKASFPFDVAPGKDHRIAIPVCPVGVLGAKQARFVLTWSPCLPSGEFSISHKPQTPSSAQNDSKDAIVNTHKSLLFRYRHAHGGPGRGVLVCG